MAHHDARSHPNGRTMMTMMNDPTAKTLAELGVQDAQAVARLFLEVKNNFAAELDAKKSPDQWEELRGAWLGRKSGILTRISGNWLKPATPDLKRAVGQALQRTEGLRRVGTRIAASRARSCRRRCRPRSGTRRPLASRRHPPPRLSPSIAANLRRDRTNFSFPRLHGRFRAGNGNAVL